MKIKFLSIFLLSILCTTISFSQDKTTPEGSWFGIINTQGFEIKLAFHIVKKDSLFIATMDSPDQQAFGIPVSAVSYRNSMIKIEIINAQIEYSGLFTGDRIMGTFKQSGLSFPLNLSRRPFERVKRPQEPREPLPYNTEEVSFTNLADSITFGGTLSKPRLDTIKYVFVLISGSGQQNRDCEIFGHKPFLVLSDYLARNGIAVLRFDDRGIGKSGGNAALSTTRDFANDVVSALRYLKGRAEFSNSKFGLIGHSEGGLIAPLVASSTDMVDLMILLAAPAQRGKDIILKQQRMIASASGISKEELDKYENTSSKLFDLVSENLKNPELYDMIYQFMHNESQGDEKSAIEAQARSIVNPWMLEFLFYDPVPALKNCTIPALAINGEMDLQVDPENLVILKNSYGDQNKISVLRAPGLNHLLQPSDSGSPAEYAKIEITISDDILKTVTRWIHDN